MKWVFGALVFALASVFSIARADTGAEHMLSKGESLLAAGDFDGAIAEYHQALQMEPRNPKSALPRKLGLALKRKTGV